jgi:tRNA-splicing ligase RtcB
MSFANRQVILHRIREVSPMSSVALEDLGMHMVYGVPLAKLERHLVGGKMKSLLVHRKGDSRLWSRNGRSSRTL